MTAELHERVEFLLTKPYPTRKDLEAHCREARLQGYRSVAVPSSLTQLAYQLTEENGTKVCCLIGYPFGHSDPDAKRYETEVAVDLGAHEIELVPCLGRLRDGDYKQILREIRDIVDAADERPVKVAVETTLWKEEQLQQIISLILDSGAQFISTSITPARNPPSADHIQELRTLIGPAFGLKVGGLQDLDAAAELLNAGANSVGFFA